MHHRRPYVQSASTGESGTRQFVETFLEAYISPAEAQDGSQTRSVYDTIYSTVARPQDVLYKNGSRNPLKSYIGRATAIASGHNPNETIWCVAADISQACRYLTAVQRRAIVLKFVYDYADETIATALGVPQPTVTSLLSESIDILAGVLDGNHGV